MICGYTLQTLLQSHTYSLILDMNVGVANLGALEDSALYIENGFYPLHPLIAMFSYMVDTSYHRSCDPWTSNITYYQIDPYIESAGLLVPNAKDVYRFSQQNQCDEVWRKVYRIAGGLGNDVNDFPGEYRPMFRFPNSIDYSIVPDLVNDHGATILTRYTDSHMESFGQSNFTAIHFQDTTYVKGIDKTYSALAILNAYFNRGCSMYQAPIDSVNHISGHVQFGAYAGRAIEMTDSISTYIYNPIASNDTFTIQMNSAATFQNIKTNPSERFEINLVYDFNQLASSAFAPNSYIYFTGITNANTQLHLYKEVAGVLVPCNSFVNLFNPNVTFFALDTLHDERINKLYLEIAWNDCGFMDSTRSFTIVAHAGVACKGYSFLMSNDFGAGAISYSCMEFNSDTIPMHVDNSAISVSDFSNPPTMSNCSNFQLTTTVSSLGADISNGLLTITTQPGCVLMPNSSTVSFDGITLNLFSPSCSPIFSSSGGTNTYIWSIDFIIDAGYSGITSVHFNSNAAYSSLQLSLGISANGLPLYATNPDYYVVTIEASGADLCGVLDSEFINTINIPYDSIPIGYLSILANGTLCNGDSVLLSAVLDSINPIVYLW